MDAPGNPFAAPERDEAPPSEGLRREGSWFFLPAGSDCPRRCIRTGSDDGLCQVRQRIQVSAPFSLFTRRRIVTYWLHRDLWRRRRHQQWLALGLYCWYRYGRC